MQLFLFATLLVAVSRAVPTRSEVSITEIAARGTPSVCGGNDWVEIHNPLDTGENTTNTPNSIPLFDTYILHGTNGIIDARTIPIPQDTALEAGGYLLLCFELTPSTSIEQQFGIEANDTITLVRFINTENGTHLTNGFFEVLSSVEPLPDLEYLDVFDTSFAVDPDTGVFGFTSTPTPGSKNVMTPVIIIDIGIGADERNTTAGGQNGAANPTQSPSPKPSFSPTRLPTRNPTRFPTRNPTRFPTRSPTLTPTNIYGDPCCKRSSIPEGFPEHGDWCYFGDLPLKCCGYCEGEDNTNESESVGDQGGTLSPTQTPTERHPCCEDLVWTDWKGRIRCADHDNEDCCQVCVDPSLLPCCEDSLPNDAVFLIRCDDECCKVC